MNRLALIRWPGGSGGSGSGGTALAADNGTSVLAGNVVLGNDVGGNLGALLTPREIPFNNQSILFSGMNGVPSGHLIFKQSAAGTAANSPFLEFQNNSGAVLATVRMFIPASPNLSTIITDDGAAASTGRNNFFWGSHVGFNVTDSFDNILMGAQAGWSLVTGGKNIVIGADSFNTGIVGNIGNFNTCVGTNNYDAGAFSVGSSNVIIGEGNQGGSGNLGNNNIIIGCLNGAGGVSNTTIIGSSITNGLSNIVVLGKSTQNVIIGAISGSITDTGDRLQVRNGSAMIDVLPISNNVKTVVAWDNTTHQLVSASGVTILLTANNGLTVNPPNSQNVQLGGTLIQNTTITANGFTLAVNGALTGGGATVNANNTLGPGLFVSGVSASSGAIVALNTGTGFGVNSSTLGGGSALYGSTQDSSTNTVLAVLQLHRFTSGTAANGIGNSIDFYNQTTTSAAISNSIISKWTDATGAAPTSQFSITGVNAGSLNSLVTMDGNGTITALGNLSPTNTFRSINTTNTAIKGETTSGNAVFGVATTGVGGAFNTTSGNAGVQGFSVSTLGGNFANQPASTNTVVPVVAIQRGTSGTAANGIGLSINLGIDTTTQAGVLSNQIISSWTDATQATRTSLLSLTGVNSGVLQTVLTISAAGIFTLTQGLGNFVNDAAAAAGGIPVNGLYRNGSIVQIRVV